MVASRARRRRRRMRMSKNKQEIQMPTPERLSKGNVIRLPSGQMKSVNQTFVDTIRNEQLFDNEPDREDLYFSLDFMLDLTERSGLFSSATRNISELSFVRGGYNNDMSAADEWRQIVNGLTSDAKRTIINLMADTKPRSIGFLQQKLSHFRELDRSVQHFRFGQILLTKSKN